MLAFHIGGESAEFVRVTIIGDGADDWLPARVDLAIGAFTGAFLTNFTSMALSRFSTEVRELYRTLSGVATFTDYERQLELQLACDLRGHIKVTGEATDIAGTGNRLEFRLELDQTHLPPVLATLDEYLKKRPASAV